MESARHLFETDETVRRIARLARLDLDPATLELLRRQLGDILGYVEQLDALDTTGVEPLAAAGESTRFRAPDLRLELQPGDHVKNAPDHSTGAFRVPKVL
ncbi:MAG: Asp-tRNA(Asn)/Glu-tRNA(Gln) amidotransferase subunit GatC [Bradymonadia bacterium]